MFILFKHNDLAVGFAEPCSIDPSKIIQWRSSAKYWIHRDNLGERKDNVPIFWTV